MSHPTTRERPGALPFLRVPVLLAAAGALALAMLACGGEPSASEAPAVSAGAATAGEAAAPLVVKIHADWCGTCQRLEPTWQRIERELGDRAQVVVLDVTDRDRLEAARKQAEALGIAGFFDQYKNRTGTIGVLSGTTHEPVAVFKGELDFDAYADAVKRAAAGGGPTRS